MNIYNLLNTKNKTKFLLNLLNDIEKLTNKSNNIKNLLEKRFEILENKKYGNFSEQLKEIDPCPDAIIFENFAREQFSNIDDKFQVLSGIDIWFSQAILNSIYLQNLINIAERYFFVKNKFTYNQYYYNILEEIYVQQRQDEGKNEVDYRPNEILPEDYYVF